MVSKVHLVFVLLLFEVAGVRADLPVEWRQLADGIQEGKGREKPASLAALESDTEYGREEDPEDNEEGDDTANPSLLDVSNARNRDGKSLKYVHR